MHEWLSGGVSPCQGEGRGFESRLVLKKAETWKIMFLLFSTCRKPKYCAEEGSIQTNEKLIKAVLPLNKKLGIYHTLDMLNEREILIQKCIDKEENTLVMDFLALWEERSS